MNDNLNQNNNEVNNSINQINENINPNQVVTPIQEVKIEKQENTTIVPNNQPQNNNSNNNGSSKSTILLFILFAFLFIYIMGMPYINEFIDNMKADTGLSEIEKEAQEIQDKLDKEEAEQNKPVEVEKLSEITCTSTSKQNGSYNVVQTQKFKYNSKKEIISSENIYSYKFTYIDDIYNSLKKECDENSLKYVTHAGYSMACSYNDTNIEISHEFDLEIFKPIVDGTTNIQANTKYKQNINTVKNNLTKEGYTCK